MDYSKMTREQLKAYGLTDEQINAILGATQDSSGNALPFPLLKVNYDTDLAKAGDFGYNPIKGDDGFVEEYEHVFTQPAKIRFLKSVFQYSKFDATQNRPTVTSNIFALKDAKQAYDLKSGLPIRDLKAQDDEIKFQRISLGVIYDEEGNEYPFIWYIKGKYLFDLNDILNGYQNNGHLKFIFSLKNKKQKKGSVTYFVPECVEVEELPDEDFIKHLAPDADKIAKFDAWIEEVNSGGSATKEAAPATASVDVDDDDDIDWD